MTSGVAKGMHLAGFPMANSEKDLLGATPHQPYGHYEDSRLVTLNDLLLREHGGSWDRPPALPWDMKYVGAAASYIESRGPSQWGMKDPRLVLTWPIWEQAFSQFHFDLIRIKVYRDVDQIVQSLFRRDGTSPGEATWLTAHYHKKMDEI